MNRLRGSQKQTVTLKKFHHLVRSMSSAPGRNKRWPLINTPMVIVGLTTTVGISSLTFAAHQQAAPMQNQSIETATVAATTRPDPDTTSLPANSTLVDNSGPTHTNESGPSATVTINGEAIPLQNGTVQRTYGDANGNTYNIDVSVSSHTTDTGNASATHVTVQSHSSSIEQYRARGSPQQ